MDIKLLCVVVLFCVATDTANAYDAPFKDHVTCADKLFALKKETACGDLQTTVTCMKQLISGSSSASVCEDENDYPYCTMLDGSVAAPMTGSNHPTLCRTYKKITSCHEEECGPSGKRFYSDRPGSQTASTGDSSCPKLATTDCVDSVKTVSEVNKDTCIAVAEAKNCYISRLSDCSGAFEEQLAVDTILAGLVQHVHQCQDKGIGFLRDPNDICVPNPLDVFFPRNIKDRFSGNPSQNGKGDIKATKAELCQLVESVGLKFDNYLIECNVSEHNMRSVNQILAQLIEPRFRCLQEKYRELESRNKDSNPGGHGVRCQPSGMATIVVAILAAIFVRAGKLYYL